MPEVHFVSEVQKRRFIRLQSEQAYYQRLIDEVVKPIAEAMKRANVNMNEALAEIGVPVDGRVVRLIPEESRIFFEDANWEWSDALMKGQMRSQANQEAFEAKFRPKPPDDLPF